MTKQQLRANMKLFLTGLTAQERHTRSLAACERLIGTREFKHAQTVMIFLSMPAEVETSTLAVKAWQECKTIVVPRMDWNHRRMEPVEIKSLEMDVRDSEMAGVREPIAGQPVPLGVIDMVVIPGLAFDRQGYRLGRGRGFYDRFLSQQEFKATRAALCFHEQLRAEPLPCEAHDVPMHLIVTDAEVVRCHQAAHVTGKDTP